MICVLSMKDVTNNDVTDFYMETIYMGCNSVEQTNWFTWDNLPPKDSQVIVSTIIEAIRLIIIGYKKVGLWIQGILPEESYLKHHSNVRKAVLELIEKYVLRRANILFIVSKEMEQHYRIKYNIDIAEKTVIMPCFNTMITEETFANRSRYGKHIFCYAGSLAPWQCFDDTIKLYAKLEKQFDDCELRVFTRETTEAERKCSGKLAHYSIKSCSNEELQDELRNVTFGFIIRSDIEVNRVATPTKISSYLGNGVIPIYTSCLKGFSEAARGKKCVCEMQSTKDWESLWEFINNMNEADEIEKAIKDIYFEYYNREKYIQDIKRAINRLGENKHNKEQNKYG